MTKCGIITYGKKIHTKVEYIVLCFGGGVRGYFWRPEQNKKKEG